MSDSVKYFNTTLEKAAARTLVKGMAKLYHSLCAIHFDTGKYVNYNTNGSTPGITQGTLEDLQKIFDHLVTFAHAEDRLELQKFVNLSTLPNRLHSTSVEALTCRSIKGTWISTQFIITDRFENGDVKRVLYIAEDVSAQKRDDIAKTIAKYQSLRDPLTSTLNRAGFEEVIAECKNSKEQIGFMLVDVDNFKEINDFYGHHMGDKAIKKVANTLRSITRKEDSIIRLGGDEFAIILRNCPSAAWEGFRRKFTSAHDQLRDVLPDGKPITLSVGVCFSEKGYSAEIATLADEAMYHVKKNGRGGCALIHPEDKSIEEWFDENAERRRDISVGNHMGTWRLELPKTDGTGRLICDDSTLRLFGVVERKSPEESYTIWKSGLNDEALANISKLKNYAADLQSTVMNYTYKKPNGALLNIESTATYDHEDDNTLYIYGFFSIKNLQEGKARENELLLLTETLLRNFSYAYLLDLERKQYIALRQSKKAIANSYKKEGTLSELVLYIIKDVQVTRNDGLGDITDSQTLASRLAGLNYLSFDFLDSDSNAWYRIKAIPHQYNPDGGLSHALLTCEPIKE